MYSVQCTSQSTTYLNRLFSSIVSCRSGSNLRKNFSSSFDFLINLNLMFRAYDVVDVECIPLWN